MAQQAEVRYEEMVEKMKQLGLRYTPQRMAVLKALTASKGHPRIEEIYQEVIKKFPMTSLATIYKTISTLKEMDEVREILFSEGGSRYDLDFKHPHPHLVCIRCDTVVDVPVADLVSLAREVTEQTGFQIIDQRLEFFGLCPDCQQQTNK